MNTSPETSGAAPETPTSLGELKQMFHSLQVQMIAVLITLVIMNLSVNLYIWKQVSMVNLQARELQQAVKSYLDSETPRMNDFLNQLREIAKTNAEFALIMSKYTLDTNNAPAIQLPPEAGVPGR